MKLPARSPNRNAYAQRFVCSVKFECLAKIIPLGERHLRKTAKEDTEHYPFERNHHGLDHHLIENSIDRPCVEGPFDRRERLDGILNDYHRTAA